MKLYQRLRIDESGIKEFERLTRIGPWFSIRLASGRKQKWAVFECKCGSIVALRLSAVAHAESRSCGCLRKEITAATKTTHGHMRNRRATPEYRSWSHMIGRCENENDAKYPDYGARGITVCRRWRESFEAFFEDMGPRPSIKHTLDRIDNDGNYEPGNCRWATKRQQGRNTRRNRMLTFDGETMCLADWAERTGIPRSVLQIRLRDGWSIQRALTTPKGTP